MKKLNIKAFMVITLFFASLFATPTMAVGSTNNDDFNPDQMDNPEDLIGGFQQYFGALFGSMGYGGLLLGKVFELLLLQFFTDFNNSEILPGVYEISATIEHTINASRDFRGGKSDYYMVPYEYYEPFASNFSGYGYPYCHVYTEGYYEFNLTVGAGVTFVIWDHDGSFIRAVEKLLDFFRRYLNYESDPEGVPEDLIKEGVELITWFLIHINDIFTGDELFILNPITWQKLEIIPHPGYRITKTMRVTGTNWKIDGSGDLEIKSIPVSPNFTGIEILQEWNTTAKDNKDSYMEWLLTESDDVNIIKTIYTSFTFDVIQLWVKNFEIHINVAEIMNLISDSGNGGSVDPAAIFEGLDIEFYLFTHHLTGAFLYEDKIEDGKITTEYVRVNDTNGDPILVDGREAYVPRTNEITHRLILGGVGNFNFEEPEITGTNKFSWGLTLNQAEIYPVPVGVDLDSYLGAVPESLAYIHFGFTFEPKETELPAADGGTVPVLHGALKLDQLFAPWNDPAGANNNITNLDLAIIYVSTVLHFHLTVDTIGQDGDIILDPTQDYENTTHSLKIGNYLGRTIAGKLDFVDIAGPYYEYGTESSKTQANATTAILPVALFESETKAHETFEGTPDKVEPFAADIRLNISFNVMVYAVCFPMFENGNGIWHDPTFSVYMIFEAKGFWAIILLVAGVGLVGVATILIKRRKDARF